MDIDVDSVSFEQADKTQVPPILQKRIVAFVNHFILKTSTFLNEFVEKCEIKFIETERKMQKLEAVLVIMEQKLASIPDDEPTNNIAPPIEERKEDTKTEEKSADPPADVPNNESVETTIIETETAGVAGVKASEDARYRKYFVMVRVGVQPEAVKQKMTSEGLDASILDTPNLILPDGVAHQPDAES